MKRAGFLGRGGKRGMRSRMILGRRVGVVVGMGLLVIGCSKKPDAAADTAASASATAPMATTAVMPPPTVTVPKVDHTADANAVSGCCAALKSEAGTAKPVDKGKYEAAAAVCGGLVDTIKRGQASRASVMGTLRAQMKGGSLPGACN